MACVCLESQIFSINRFTSVLIVLLFSFSMTQLYYFDHSHILHALQFHRTVYHCPFCNLCRLGKGLGVDFFHCMQCNCCLSMKLDDHLCREKGLETNCPICCDFLFTSSASVRALPCGHFMHSACFQVIIMFLLFPINLWNAIIIKMFKWHFFPVSGIRMQPLHLSNL